ncbi:MAG: hypothetical protein FJ270_03625 [Planctomycetes bacterium]|nr:hypothetical protein [Planctomycetota bacterium]
MSSTTMEPSAPAQGKWWIGLFLVIAVLVAIRAGIGEGMGRAYVQTESTSYAAATDDQGRVTWSAVADGAAGSATIERDVFRTAGQYRAAEAASPNQQAIRFSWDRTIGLWLAAFFTLAVFSFLVGDNPAYKFTESIVIGVSAGYWMAVAFWETLVPKLVAQLAPGLVKAWCMPNLDAGAINLDALIPLGLGIMLLSQLTPLGRHVGRWPLAFVIGTFAGLKMISHVESDIIEQVRATMLPLVVFGDDGSFAAWASIRNLLIVAGVLCTLVYFVFSIEHKGPVGRAARVGVWFLMITFGSAFGFTVMGRIALLAARFEFLFIDWLWLIDPKGQRTMAAVSAAAELGSSLLNTI